MDTKKIFVMLLLGIFMISIVSAVSYDYNDQTRTAKFSKTFLFWDTGDLADVQLLTPLDYKVGLGEQYVWEMKVSGFDDYQDFISEMDFYDRKNGMAKINRDFDLRKREVVQVLVDDYDCSNTFLNKTGWDCKVVGSHYEDKVIWTKLKQIDFKKNDVLIIRMYTFVEAGDRIEWIPTIASKKVPEWATWTADLNTGLIHYYAFEEGSGNFLDSVGSNNLTDMNTVGRVTGHIGNSVELDGGADYLLGGNVAITGDTARTSCFWAEADDNSDGTFLGWGTHTEGDSWTVMQANYNARGYQVSIHGGDHFSGTQPYQTGWTFHCVILQSDGNTVAWHYNGSSTASWTDTNPRAVTTGSGALSVGYDPSGYLNYWDGEIDELGIWNRQLTGTEITQLYNGGTGLTYDPLDNDALIVTLISPANATEYTTSPQSINFICYGSDDVNFTSMEFYINGSLTQTNSSGLNNTNYTFTESLTDGEYNWSCKGNDNESEQTASSTRYLTIDSISPVISPAFNVTDLVTFSLPINTTWHFNATDVHLDKCYYNTTENSTYKIITCNSTENTEWATSGSKTIQFCANDTLGFETCNSTSLNIYYITYNQSNNPDTIAESFDVTFNLTVNLTSIPTTTANLYVNNTLYTPTATAGTNGYYFEKTVTIPNGWGNTTGILQDWYWNYTINGIISNQNTSTENITVYELAIDDCSTYGDLILNFSLNNEETNAPVNESAGANVEVDLTLTSKEDPTVYVTYSNTWTNENNPQVCLPNNVLNNSEYWLDLTVGFDSTDHVWEFYYIDDGTLNSTKILQSFNGDVTTNIDLMDLTTTDSTSFLFNYFNQDGLAVVDAIVHPMRKYIGDGQFLEVERSKADQNGDTIVHLVEEDVIYFFYITQYGVLLHTSSTYTALCQATPCTIQIEASGDGAEFGTDWDLIDGGGYQISDDASSRTVNLTYLVNSSRTVNLTVYKYNNDGSYSAINTTSSTGTSDTLLMTVPQSAGNVSFFASVIVDDEFINSEWIDFEQKAGDQMSTTLALFLGALIILTLGLMAVTEGVGTLVMVILGVVIAGSLGLIRTELSTGVNVIIYLVVAGGILLWKLTGGRK